MSEEIGLMDFIKAALAEIREITPEELITMQAGSEDLLLLDVREPGEFTQGHLSGAKLIPRGILEAAADHTYPKRVQELVDARNRPIAIYCATGGRSAMAANTLRMMGFVNVMSLQGGISRWQGEGKDIESEARYV